MEFDYKHYYTNNWNDLVVFLSAYSACGEKKTGGEIKLACFNDTKVMRGVRPEGLKGKLHGPGGPPLSSHTAGLKRESLCVICTNVP